MMKKFNINVLILLLLLLNSCGEKTPEKQSRTERFPYYNEETFTPLWFEKDSDKIRNLHTIPSFSLVNQEGKIISQETFENKIYVTDFFFTSCMGICPQMTKNLNVVQEAFIDDDEILILSHSVMPTVDSVSVLKNYAELHDINSKKWHLVTGNKKEIYDLGRKSYFIEEDLGLNKNSDDFLHTENIVLIDKNKHIRGIYNGLNKTSIEQLIADVKTLKKE